MNKKIVLLPLLGFLLASCGVDAKDPGNNGENQDPKTQETGGRTETGSETETGGGQQTGELTEEEKTQRIVAKKGEAKSKLDELVLPLISKIPNDDIKQFVQTFYDSEKAYIESIVELETAEAALAKVVSDFATFTINTLKPEVVSKLNTIVNPIISSITVNELRTSVQTFYNEKITKVNALTSPSEIVDYLINLKNDVQKFITSETGRLLVEFKNKALNKLEELVNPLVAKITNEYLKQSVQSFISTEKEYLQGINELSEAKEAPEKVTTDLSNFAVNTFKPLLIEKLNDVINPLIAKIEYTELNESVQGFYDNEIDSIKNVTSLGELIDLFPKIKKDFEDFVVSETERILTALKNKEIEELDPYVTTLIAKIPYEEIKDDFNAFYLEEKQTLLDVTEFNDVPTTVAKIKKDLEDFVLTESKKVALVKLKEVVDAGLMKIPNEDLKSDLTSFADTEYGKLNAVGKIEDVPTTLATVTEETANHIKTLLATTAKDYIDKLTQIETSTAYDYLPEAMSPTYANNLVNPEDIAYDFTEFTGVSSINQKGFGEQWQMVVDNINQSSQLAKVFNVAQTALNSATQAIKIYIDNTYADEMSYTLPNSVEGVVGSFNYKDLVLSVHLEMTQDYEIPLAGTVKPVIDMKYDLLKDEKEMFISLGDTYKLRYIISESRYEMATTYGVTIGGKTGSRSSYLGIDIEDGVTSGHIYEYTRLQDSDLIKACADFYVANGYVSVVGNKASALVGSTAVINELYNASNGHLLGYMVEEDIKSVTYHTFWFNLADINGISNIKCIPNNVVDPTENHSNVYVNDSDKILRVAHNKMFMVDTSRKYDIELRSHYYYSLVENAYVCSAVEIPMMMIQDDDKYYDTIYSNSDFTDFPNDMDTKSGISGAYVKTSDTVVNKIRNDCKLLGEAFNINKENMSSQAINEYLGIVEE